MDKQAAGKILLKLESTASEVDTLAKAGKIDPKVASELVKNIDQFSDKFEIAAFGKAAFEARKAKVLEQDSDEPYMKTFENPQKVIEGDPDEPYMHESGASFNGKSIPTYDSDDTSQVTDRDEYSVRDESEWSDGTKQQPSWTRGPAGKSTKQGSGKTWAS